MVKAYLDAVSERKGILESSPRKLLKSVALAAIGMGIGGAISGYTGAAFGGAAFPAIAQKIAEKLAEFGADTGIGLLDSLVLEPVTKGWSPRMFFDDLSKLRDAKTK